ncbi:MAG: hypothetical protein GC151_20250 [Betaproteobacteria bacterium]|nr:hypothetical protein [Betaproteobacteria bacterium]
MRTLYILVPGLFWPDLSDERPYAGLSLPKIQRLLGKGRLRRLGTTGLETWLARTWGYEAADVPAAPVLAHAHGHETGADTWICADPVHLGPRGTELFLTAGHALDIRADEAEELVHALNAFFEEDGIRVHALRPDRWIARIGKSPRLQTVPLSEAHGRAIDPLLPRGDEAMTWIRRLNEAQMLMHSHAVNAAREEQGRPPVNSLWFWGGGRFSAPPGHPFEKVYADDALLRAFAHASGIEVEALPESMQTVLGAASRGPVLMHYPFCARAADSGDLDAWRASLVTLDGDCVGPALGALGAGIVDRIELVGLSGRHGIHANLQRLDALRFWRRAAQLGLQLLGTEKRLSHA